MAEHPTVQPPTFREHSNSNIQETEPFGFYLNVELKLELMVKDPGARPSAEDVSKRVRSLVD